MGSPSRFPAQTSLQAGGERAGRRVRVKPTDVLDLSELPLVKAVSPEFMQEVPVVYGNKQSSHMTRGVAASYGAMRSETPQPGGRFLDDEDVRLRRRVVFIGSEVQRKLFAGVSPVGETIRVKGIPFEIIGVGVDKVQMSNYNRPDKFCLFRAVDGHERARPMRSTSRISSFRRCRRPTRPAPFGRSGSSWRTATVTTRTTNGRLNIFGSAQMQADHRRHRRTVCNSC